MRGERTGQRKGGEEESLTEEGKVVFILFISNMIYFSEPKIVLGTWVTQTIFSERLGTGVFVLFCLFQSGEVAQKSSLRFHLSRDLKKSRADGGSIF